MRAFILLSVIALASAGTVQESLLAKAKSGKPFDAVLELPSHSKTALSSKSLIGLSGDAKIDAMVSELQSMAQAAQAPYMEVLSKLGVGSTKPLWITNQIGLYDIDESVLVAIQAIDGDFYLREEKWVHIAPAIEHADATPMQGDNAWGVDKIRAPAAWAKTKGEGVVVGIIDTGARVAHEALKTNFAGAWSDPYYNRDPTDANGHGSHALGSIVGTTKGIGVAPGAKWVACRGLNDQGSGSTTNLNKCAEWMLTADPKPRIISNSWGGGEGDDFYNDAIDAWRAAGMIPVFAIGNSGPSCRTAISPGDQPNVISVGATSSDDKMADFSSRGAAVSGDVKPDVSAPGNAIYSVGAGTSGYKLLSGTSMATPHVAGAIALILSANPTYTFDDVLKTLTETAAQPSLTNVNLCGSSGDWPNNAYGYGRIDVGKALGV